MTRIIKVFIEIPRPTCISRIFLTQLPSNFSLLARSSTASSAAGACCLRRSWSSWRGRGRRARARSGRPIWSTTPAASRRRGQGQFKGCAKFDGSFVFAQIEVITQVQQHSTLIFLIKWPSLQSIALHIRRNLSLFKDLFWEVICNNLPGECMKTPLHNVSRYRQAIFSLGSFLR